MEKSNGRSAVPVCPLTHSLLDRLTVIVGHCELLGAADSVDSHSSKHLRMIQEAAQSMAAELKNYQCELIALRKHQKTGNRQHEQLAEIVQIAN
jgi:hypothetical protein